MSATRTFTPRRGRPRPDQAAAIARSILDSAKTRFLAEGFDKASMEAIAAGAGVPKSTLYKRYPDKMSLLRAVLEDRRAAWSAVASQSNWRLPGALEPRLKLHAEKVLVWAGSEEVRAFRRLATGVWNGAAEVASVLDLLGYGGMVDYLEEEIRAFGPASGLQAAHPRRVAEALMALLSGWLAAKAHDDQVSELDARAFAEMAVDLLIRGKDAW